MTVKVAMPVRESDLVVPLAHEATAMRTTETAGSRPAASGAVSGSSDRAGDVDSTNGRSTRPTAITPGLRTSTTATRTTTTRSTSTGCASSADETGSAEFSLKDLVVSHLCCREHKRNTAAAIAFEANLAENLCELLEALRSRTYRPGPSVCFIITWPKVREVWAADYRDRVVHHLLYNKIGPRFERSFIADSCACIKGRGTMYAAERLEGKIRSVSENWQHPAHYLKCDIRNFFVSIPKPVLAAELAAKVQEPFWLWLARTILFHDPRADVRVNASAAELALVPREKSLFAQDADHGLPIGNLSSQFFANVFLNVLDQHVKHDLRARHYIRYVDDFILLDRSTEWLNYARADIEAFLPARLGVALHPKKTILQPVDRGVDFAGQVVKPWHRTIRKRTRNEALRRLAVMPETELFESANSYLGLCRQASHSHVDRASIARVLLQRGFAIDQQLTKTFRKAA